VGGGHWLVRMEWLPAGWLVSASVNLPLKSRSSLLAPSHPGGPAKRAEKWLWCGGGGGGVYYCACENFTAVNFID